MPGKSLADQIVVLLEAERAGVAAARALLEAATDQDERELMSVILDGERESCRVLGRTLLQLGTRGSGNTGDFARKVMALENPKERLDLLVKGQEWVVRRIDEALQLGPAAEIARALGEIRDVHVTNIGKCREYLESWS